MAARKSRSRKPKATTAPVEVVADSPSIDEEKMVEDGFEKTRARDDKGHFVKDDPSTPENEAFQWTKSAEEAPKPAPVKKVAKAEPAPVKKVAKVKPEPVKEVKKAEPKKAPEAPVVSSYDELTHSDTPLYGSQRFRAKKAVKRGER